MSIIIISSDSRKIEASIAESVAETIDFQLLDQRLLDDVAGKYGIESEKLRETLETTPSLLKGLSSRQWRYYLSCIETEVLDRLLADNIVCRGLAAHLYVTGVSHVLKVRVLAGTSGQEMDPAEKSGTRSQKSAKQRAAELAQRKKWSLTAFNYDETDLSRYDLVINLDQIDPVEAVRTITGAVEYRRFQVMTYSMKCLSDLALAAKVNEALLKSMTDVSVQARDGSVIVSTKSGKREKRKKIETIKKLAGSIEGVNYVEVHVEKTLLGVTG